MTLTKEYIEGEIAQLQGEQRKAQDFLQQSAGAIAVYEMLLGKLNEPVEESQEGAEECANTP